MDNSSVQLPLDLRPYKPLVDVRLCCKHGLLDP